MRRWKPETSTPIPPVQRWQSRQEILKAHLDSLSPSELLQVRPDYYALRFGLAGPQGDYIHKYDPNQPRDDHGRWSDVGGGQGNGESIVQGILARAKQLAARSTPMSRCIDICSPILERFQLPGIDRNETDFRKCLNACLGRLGR